MTKFVAYDPASGEILVWGDVDDPQFQATDGRQVLEVDAGGDTHHVVAGAVVAYTDAQRAAKAARPDWDAVWSNEAMSWVDLRNLEDARADQRALLKVARDAEMLDGFVWNGSRFNADDLSQQRLQGAAITAMINPAFATTWTLFDNSTRVLSAADILGVFAAGAAFVGANFAKGQALQAQLAAATTLDAIKSVVWTP